MTTMINVSNLKFSYPKFELSDINFEIESGEIVAITGNNACGKTTLLNLLAGLIKPKKGTILIDGSKVVCGNNIGMVFQNPDNQIIFGTVQDDISFTLKNHKVPRQEWDARISEALSLVNLSGFEKHDTNSLSAGQKQRLVIANMLATKPKLLLLDEVSVYLDPTAKIELYKLFAELKKQGITIIFATNALDEIVFADRVMLLEDGKIKSFETKTETLKHLELFENTNMHIPLKLSLINKFELYDLQFDENILAAINGRKK